VFKYQLNQVWDQLRSRKPHLEYFLEEARIQGLRGISDLNIRFNYPVSVLSGPNACGKSTVLFTLACAYKVPSSGLKDFVPSTMFPDFLTKKDDYPTDKRNPATLEFYYIHEGQRYRMSWSRGTRNWNRSFLGLKGGKPPERTVYLRTMANLSNPSEVRGVLQFGHQELRKEEITADLLTFAHRILPLHYKHLILMSQEGMKGKNLLFAEREDLDGVSYSEFHMSAGERAILRLSSDISRYKKALILIDEIEAGLHPFTQQQLMLELQRLALRNDLQVVVATHSPVILDTVPPEGRIFLERTSDNNVIVHPPYRDIIQKAYYGRSIDKLSILCEDDAAEATLRGIMDLINRRLNLTPTDIEIGRDTGKDEFPHHVRAMANFRQLENFIFVLDGDGRDKEADIRQVAKDKGQPIKLLFLPGDKSPEDWVWDQILTNPSDYAEEFRIDTSTFADLLRDIDRMYDGATDTPRNKAKGRMIQLSSEIARDVSEICRIVGCKEAERESSPINDLVGELEEAVRTWRNLSR